MTVEKRTGFELTHLNVYLRWRWSGQRSHQ
jgi:hypothetical protein